MPFLTVCVEITRLVGIYSRPAEIPSGHAVVFAAVPTGGEMKTQPGETTEIHYFPSADLPEMLAFGHRRRIEDAVQGVRGAVVSQRPEKPPRHRPNREELYLLRDASGLSPEQFYMDYFEPGHILEERVL